MLRRLIYRALAVLAFIAALVLYILGVLLPDAMGMFTIPVCVMILAAAWGLILLVKSLASKLNTYLILSAILITGAAIWAGLEFQLLPKEQQWLYIPIGIGFLAIFALFRYLFNIRRWDAGDNEKLGYKNFRVRQQEKEKEEIDEQISELEKELRLKEKEKALLMMDIEEKKRQKESVDKKK